MTTRSWLCMSLYLALASGCAPNYYSIYRDAHPEWTGVFPDLGATVEETVAGLYAPPTGDYQRLIIKLRVLEAEAGAWQDIPLAQLKSGQLEAGNGTYAVVAKTQCISEVAMVRYTGDRVSWYLLPDNELQAYDHYDFTERCVIGNTFEPSPKDLAQTEKRLVSEIVQPEFRPHAHTRHYYEKGIRLTEVGRTDDAIEMLIAGDRAFDLSPDRRVRFDPGRQVSVAGDAEAASSRAALVDALKAGGAIERPPGDVASPSPDAEE